MIPSLPPIIKPSDTPIKIVPKRDAQAGTPSQTGAGTRGDGRTSRHPRGAASRSASSANPGAARGDDDPGHFQRAGRAAAGRAARPLRNNPPGVPWRRFTASVRRARTLRPTGVAERLSTAEPPPAGSRPVQTINIQPRPADLPPLPTPRPPAPEARPARPRPQRHGRSEKRRRGRLPGGPLSIVPTQETRAPAPPRHLDPYGDDPADRADDVGLARPRGGAGRWRRLRGAGHRRNAARLKRRRHSAPCRRNIRESLAAIARLPPRRSRRQGRLLPRSGRTVCLVGTGGQPLQQSEGCRRQLPYPKKLVKLAA